MVHIKIYKIQYLKWNKVYEGLTHLCRLDNKLLTGIIDDQKKLNAISSFYRDSHNFISFCKTGDKIIFW